MNSRVYCLDSNVIVKILMPEEGSEHARDLLREAISAGGQLIAPEFAWAEVGTVLRKKMRAGHITESEADAAWEMFSALSIDYIQDTHIPSMAWRISSRYGFPTLYDAAFLAVCEWVQGGTRVPLEFCTADKELISSLEASPPFYVRLLGQ